MNVVGETHVGQLYSITGNLLASATFTGETGTGWQNVMFSTPVTITPNTPYVAAYFSSLGNYIGTANYFTNPVQNIPLTGLANDDPNGPNGVYVYTGVPAFPITTSGVAPNYWVDALFSEGSQPLPVQYLYFNANKQGDNVTLRWATANEQNNEGFEVQRSADGTSWAVLGFVAGIGNSQTEKDYQYLDQNLPGGTYYYRLRQIDYDGHSAISKVVQISIADGQSLELLQNRPNPFNNSTTIGIVIPKAGRVQLMLYDQFGRPVRQIMDEYKMPGTYNIQVYRNGLSSGIYYYKLNALGQSIAMKMTIL